MDTTKCVMASVAGGLVYFVLGWVIYGMLITDSPNAAMEPNIALIGLASLFLGGVLALVLGWRGVSSHADAFKAACGFGVLLGLAIGIHMMGSMDTEMTLVTMLRDAVIGGLMYGVSGVAVGMVMGRGDAADA